MDAGKEVVIHLTCKDLNRNGLESEAWLLNSEGFHSILAMTGDHPFSGIEGLAKPVFDIDSVGLISMLNKMNQGLDPKDGDGNSKGQRLEKTRFCIGAVTTNYKLREGEVMPQYFKLLKKIGAGAQFIINQIGFDSRKDSELRLYMDQHGMKSVPLIGNVYLLNPKVAQLFHEGRIPGIVLTQPLLDLCLKHGQSADGGRSFFCEFAAKRIAIYRGLGYRGVYLAGCTIFPSLKKSWKSNARSLPMTGNNSRGKSGSPGPANISTMPKIRRRDWPMPPFQIQAPKLNQNTSGWFIICPSGPTISCSAPAAR